MANPDLISYIKQNSTQFSRPILTQHLVAAGWQRADIDAAFAEIDGVPGGPIQTPTQTTPEANVDFIAQMQQRREEAARAGTGSIMEGNTEIRPNAAPANMYAGQRAANAGEQKGIIGMLIKTGLVKTEAQANIVMIVFIIAMLGATAWLLL